MVSSELGHTVELFLHQIYLFSVLETVHSIACIHIMYTLAIRGFANIKNLAEIPW